MAAYQTVYTQTHRLLLQEERKSRMEVAKYKIIASYMICRHINTEMTIRQTCTTEK